MWPFGVIALCSVADVIGNNIYLRLSIAQYDKEYLLKRLYELSAGDDELQAMLFARLFAGEGCGINELKTIKGDL